MNTCDLSLLGVGNAVCSVTTKNGTGDKDEGETNTQNENYFKENVSVELGE